VILRLGLFESINVGFGNQWVTRAVKTKVGLGFGKLAIDSPCLGVPGIIKDPTNGKYQVVGGWTDVIVSAKIIVNSLWS
jgi:hypothetical protein